MEQLPPHTRVSSPSPACYGALAAALSVGARPSAGAPHPCCAPCTRACRDLDMIATDLAAALPVDIMPGAQDPTNVALPQQPLHKWVMVVAPLKRACWA